MAKSTATRLNLMSKSLPPFLSDEEIRQEIYKFKTYGEYSSLEKIVLHNLSLVKSIVFNDIWYEFADKEELISIGVIGLIKSVDTFDLNSDNKFSTYATVAIKNSIYAFLKKERLYRNQKVYDLNEYIKDNKNDKELNYRFNSNIQDTEKDYMYKILIEQVRKEIFKLPIKNRTMLILAYGLFNDTRFSLAQIGVLFGYCRENVRMVVKEDTALIVNNLEESLFLEKVDFENYIFTRFKMKYDKPIIEEYEDLYNSLNSDYQSMIYSPEEIKIIRDINNKSKKKH